MPREQSISLLRTALLLGLLPLVIANPHGTSAVDNKMDMGGMGADSMNMSHSTPDKSQMEAGPMSYFRYGEHSGWIYAHIAIMVVTWTAILPLGVMLSVAKSRYTFPAQALFFILNALGIFLSVVYDAKTPDLYENNAHHKIGWIFSWIAVVWIALGVLNTYAGHFGKNRRHSGQQISVANMARYSRLQNEEESQEPRRWSGDSGQGTDRNSYSMFGSGSPDTETEQKPFDEDLPALHNVDDEGEAEKPGILRNTRLDRFLLKNIHKVAADKTLRISQVLYIVIERLIIIMGWIAITTGAVTFSGIFRSSSVLNGLAHWIKGGIFFWYGLLTLGRWMGAFGDFGWAWNIKPGSDIVPRWKSRIPTAEFTESFVIFLYGITNVFLEHLSAWGDAWAPSDLEHLAITFLFFGGGLLGMLVESSTIRELLSTHMIMTHEQISHNYSLSRPGTPETEEKKWTAPKQYTVPLNPMPALVILLLGIMMSAHQQDSMTSSMIHKQWGTLFVGFAMARGVTYILLYIKPPTSYLPARPPTELITAFCLSSGGLIFMASSRDVVQSMEYNGLDAMFGFTVTMGLTAAIMAWVVTLVAIKGWAVRKERPSLFKQSAGAA